MNSTLQFIIIVAPLSSLMTLVCTCYLRTLAIIWQKHRWRFLYCLVLPLIYQARYYYLFSKKLDTKDRGDFKWLLFSSIFLAIDLLALQLYASK